MKRNYLLLIFILVTAFLVRLYRIDAPLADWHSWRQVDTVGVTREFLKTGIDLLHPRYMDISSIPSGQFNPKGWRMVEFPIINGLVAFLYRNIPFVQSLELHVFSRLVSILFSLGSLTFLYLVVEQFSGTTEALLAALVFAVLPYNIYFSRVVLPEVPLVFFSLASLYFLIRYFYIEKHTLTSPYFWLSAGSTAIALLLKPYAIFLALPAIYIGWKKCKTNLVVDGKSYLWLALVLIPFLLWRVWIQQFPEGIPAYQWLLNGNGIRFKGAFFQWIFADRLGRLILGYWGLIPFGLGLLVHHEKDPILPTSKGSDPGTARWFYRWWLMGILAYVTVFATGNVQHDYYQIIAVPIICIFVAKGFSVLLHPPKSFSVFSSYLFVLISSLFMLAFGWYHVRDYFNINHPEIVEAGKAADRLLPKDAIVVAPYGGDTAFLYQINRKGWPVGGAIDDKLSKGATHYVSVKFDEETRDVVDKCYILQKTDRYAIVDLTSCRLLFQPLD